MSLTNGTGKLAAYYEYDAWGNVMTEAEKTGVENPYRYSTKEWDKKSGLSYFGARYYSSEIGRWTQRDPAGTVDGLNLYAHVANDPVGYIDPSGNQGKPSTSLRDKVRRDCNLYKPKEELDEMQAEACCKALLEYFWPVIGTGTGFIMLKSAYEGCINESAFPTCNTTGRKLVVDFARRIVQQAFVKILLPRVPTLK